MRSIRRGPLAALGVALALVACASSGSGGAASTSVPTSLLTTTARGGDGVIDERDGVLPDGVTVFDDQYPGIARVDPALLRAMRAAATDAADDGITFSVHSAWRSPEYQEQLVRDAVAEHGAEDADRWAASPERSLHVSGDAIDIGGDGAREWLVEHGAAHGICRIYGNEPWHFELRPEAVDDGCPPLYADAREDPRLQP